MESTPGRVRKYANSRQTGNGGRYFFMSVTAIMIYSVYITLNEDIYKFQTRENLYSDRSKLFSLTPTISSTLTSTTSTTSTLKTAVNNTEEWFLTPLAKDRPKANCKSWQGKKCKGRKYWTGSWPSPSELPVDQRRDTACPYTLKNEKRVKRWPDIIGIGAPKCGTGL